MIDLVVVKFGGISVVDFDVMNCSIDVVLFDVNICIVVFFVFVGVINILVVLVGGLEFIECFFQLDVLCQIQFNILECLCYFNVICEEIECLLENIMMLVEVVVFVFLIVLIDELVSYGELMFILLFVEILCECGIQVQWFDVCKVLCINDCFGCVELDIVVVVELIQQQLVLCLVEGLVVIQGFIGSEVKGCIIIFGCGGSDYIVVLFGEVLNVICVDIWIDVLGIYIIDLCVVLVVKCIDVIVFEEVVEMVIFGVKVLYLVILLFVVCSDILVFVGFSKEFKVGGMLVCKIIENLLLFCVLVLCCW